jgi:hypothetical protein
MLFSMNTKPRRRQATLRLSACSMPSTKRAKRLSILFGALNLTQASWDRKPQRSHRAQQSVSMLHQGTPLPEKSAPRAPHRHVTGSREPPKIVLNRAQTPRARERDAQALSRWARRLDREEHGYRTCPTSF